MRRLLGFALGLLCAGASFAASGPALVEAARNGDLTAESVIHVSE